MSRIGRAPIIVPAGVEVKIENGNVVTVKGKNGTLTRTFAPTMEIKLEGNVLTVSRPNDEADQRSLHGLTRTLLNNMITGVTEGYSKKLQIIGVGYSAAKSGKNLNLRLGHSHPIVFEEENGITFDVPDTNTVIVKGADKQAVGQVAAWIRAKRPPEPYLGKGVKYEDEHIRRKVGKASK